ncbi:hypothetical protein [Streptomyces chiangmaiensis]|uniref:ANTAR domain-containing protein n=1 Tax=Streptomyces chiangmaiensis TaxID=766497 RepID=A0ABU7FS44_9ACTN|nr:hypothetical protein [Streptomyces chiangmaiensis]MED7826922.1 hypothetical protein [Streptomyces chiangmaiensis]
MTRKAAPASPMAAYAARARELQRLAAVGSARRKSAGVAAIALDGVRSLEGARRRLQAHRIPTEILTAAMELLDQL